MPALINWQQRIAIPIERVLTWELHRQRVSCAIVDAAGLAADIPQRYQSCWMAEPIQIQGDNFIITLYARDTDV